MSSKGQLRKNGLLGLVTALAVAVLLGGIFSILLAETDTAAAKDKTQTETNETILNDTSTLNVLANTSQTPVESGSESLIAWNFSSGNKLGDLTKGTNYTVKSYEDGQFNITDVDQNGTDTIINATYDWTNTTTDADVTSTLNEGIDAIKTVAQFLGILGLAFIGGFIIRFLLRDGIGLRRE